jgi:hypothetical protein
MADMKEYLVMQEAKSKLVSSFFAVIWAESEADALRKFEERGLGVSATAIGSKPSKYWKSPSAELLEHGQTYRL